jgi:protoporphyrin/coproporphyrin ferrochelatase
MKYDAILILSFGGPEKPEDVEPFLDNVLRGKPIPPERREEVAQHYRLFGGVSPINAQNRELVRLLGMELKRRYVSLPVYWGNRNWHPYLADTLRRMQKDGVRRALAYVTSAFSSYSGCRQYLEDIERARTEVGEGAPEIDKLRVFYNHPTFIEIHARNIQTTLAALPAERRASSELVFTAHSIPISMSATCDYVVQLQESCRLIAEQLKRETWSLVYQSRSGPPNMPWLEPDVCDHLRSLRGKETKDVVLVPVGFVSDHMEVIYDLDTEAKKVATEIGLTLIRTPTPGNDPQFVQMLGELIEERMDPKRPKRVLGNRGPNHDICPADCCKPPIQRPLKT